MEFTLRSQPLDSPDALALIAALNAELTERYPEDGATHFDLASNEVGPGHGAFLVAYDGAEAVGCGAVRLLDENQAEIKRMYVRSSFRGQRLGRAILMALETKARSLGATRLVLETGERQTEALRLYAWAGFVRIPCFGEYASSPLSLCMAKELDPTKSVPSLRESSNR